jgi:hypothetical protein
MKKIVLTLMLLALFSGKAFSGERGPLQNVYASWASVTASTTLAFPYNSRDLTIHNASAVDVIVDLRGNTIDSDGIFGFNNSTFQLQGDETITFTDYVTNAVSFKSSTGAVASPVSVIATY